MQFIYPYLLWGGVAVVIPVVIHFWYQKTGKTISWAASQWLTDQTSLQHRGMRLDEIPLLLLRCLLLILLSLILARPFFELNGSEKTTSKIHLVEAKSNLVEAYRFELDNAQKNGEKIYWIGAELQPVTDIFKLPKQTNPELYLQENVMRLGKDNLELNLYILNNQQLAEKPSIYVPENFRLHSLPDSTRNILTPYFDLGKKKKLFVDGDGKLKVVEKNTGRSSGTFASEPVHVGPVHALLNYRNVTERQTVMAGLEALAEVYSIPFFIDTSRANGKKYELVISDHKIEQDKNGLYIFSGTDSDLNFPSNVVVLPDSLRMSTSELVENGRLPELLGDMIISHFDMKRSKTQLSEQQFWHIFSAEKSISAHLADKLYPWLLLCFVLVLLAERWFSLRKKNDRIYA
jgi:hypothetical protein